MMHVRPVLLTAALLAALAAWPVPAQTPPAVPPADAGTTADDVPGETNAASDGGVAPGERRESRGNRVSIFTGDIEIPADLRQRGVVVCIGCDVDVAGQVDDDVVVVGGDIRMTGSTAGSVVGVFSRITTEGATVHDDVINVLGSLDQRETDVGGQVVDIGLGDWVPGFPSALGVFAGVVFWIGLVKLLGAFVLVVLLAVVTPERVRLIADEAPLRYGTAWFVGILAYVLLFLVILPLALATVVGLPVVFLGFKALKWLGIAGLFLAVGDRLSRSLGRPMSLLGAVLLVFTPLALLRLLPVVIGGPGIVIVATVSLLTWVFFHVPGLGLVLLTRFGTRRRSVPEAPPPV